MPIAIRNFGHFWDRIDVEWGTRGRGNQGSLLGYTGAISKPKIVDFRDQVGIYVLYAENREVVYIGQTGAKGQRLFARLKQHTNGQLRDRWRYFSWFGFRQVKNDLSLSEKQDPSKTSAAVEQSQNEKKPNGKTVQGKASDALDEIEAVLLQLFEPRLNKQGPKWRGTTEYLQYFNEDGEIDEIDLLFDIRCQIEDLKSKLGEE